MKRHYCIFIVILIWGIGSQLLAQNKGFIDGRIWNRMKTDNKLYFLSGLFTGMRKSEDIIGIEVEAEKRRTFAYTEPFYVNQIRKKLLSYTPKDENIDLSQITGLLDAFYSDSDNLRIRVTVALRIVFARQNGDIERSDLWLKEARRGALLR